MPRPPSKHGLERKYKPWRRGKSKKSKNSAGPPGARVGGVGDGGGVGRGGGGGSLKNQLRGQRRLLLKLGNDDDDDVRKKNLEDRIRSLESQIEERERVEREKKLASKYHTIKFFERQRLTRLERKTHRLLTKAENSQKKERRDDKNQPSPSSSSAEELVIRYRTEYDCIRLDQLYVAYYPNDVKYLSLFTSGGDRVVDDKRTKRKRELIRRRILELVQKKRKIDEDRNGEEEGGGTKNRKGWVSDDHTKVLEHSDAVELWLRDGGPWHKKDRGREDKDKGVSAVEDERFQETEAMKSMLRMVGDDSGDKCDDTDVASKDAEKNTDGFAKNGRKVGGKTEEEERTGEEADDDDDDGSSDSLRRPQPANDDDDESSDDPDDDDGENDDSSHSSEDSADPMMGKTRREMESRKSGSSDTTRSGDGAVLRVDDDDSKRGALKNTAHKVKEEGGSGDDDSSSVVSSSSSDADSDSETGSSSGSGSDSDEGENDDDDSNNKMVKNDTGAPSRSKNTHDREKITMPKRNENENEGQTDEKDDFFLDTSNDEGGDDGAAGKKAFDKATRHTFGLGGDGRGDKSQGWATQNQRPGKFKKRRVRR